MAKFHYPNEDHFRTLIDFINIEGNTMRKYLPVINENWFMMIDDGMKALDSNSVYIHNNSVFQECSRILYKFVKLHSLVDGNKRTGIIAVYCFCVVNNYFIVDPESLKREAKRIARSKGNVREELIKKRVTKVLENIIIPFNN